MKNVGSLLIAILLILNVLSFGLTNEEIKKAYWDSYNYEKMEKYKDAVKALMSVYNVYPNGYTINLRLGWLYYLNKNFSNSIYHYEKAIKVIPTSVEAKLGYTLPLLAQEKYDDVEKLCIKILNTDFYNYYANLRLAYVLRLKKDLKNAKKINLKMLSLYPTDVKFLTEYGLVLFAEKDYKKAKKVFEDILILDPLNITAKSYLKKSLNSSEVRKGDS